MTRSRTSSSRGSSWPNFSTTGHLHVDVLKVQHHGSENNVDENFCRKVSADHYVFCGNGSHGNPELSVIEMIYNSRLGPKKKRALAPKAEGRPFKFWFSTTSDAQVEESQQQEAYASVEELVADLEATSGGVLSSSFNTSVGTTLNI